MGRTGQRVTTIVVGVVLILGLGAALAWRAVGGTWENIGTPSMGTAAPVGSLVFSRPTTVEELHVGDVVTFQAPNPQVTHTTTHRVVAIDGTGPDATIRTRGDANGADDPWSLHTADLRGKITAIVWGGGWLLRAVPILALVMLAVWVVTHYYTPGRWRIPLRVLGVSAAVSTVAVVLKPFVGAVSLGNNADAAGTHITLVSTGVLPSQFSGAGGGSVDLVDGQVGVLTTQVPPGAKGASVTGGVHMPWWLWVLMVVLWLSPMVVGLIAESRRLARVDAAAPPDSEGGDDTPTQPLVSLTRSTPRQYRSRRLATTGAAMGVVLVALTVTGTQSAFTAKVVNATDTAASNPYFTCLAALPSPASAAPSYVWPLDDTTVSSGSTARDVGANSRTGTYTNAFTRTTNKPCPRDTGTSAVTLAPTSDNPSYVAQTNTTATASVNTFSLEIWFRTTTTTGGKLMGWGNARTGTSSTYDRHLYMTNDGKIVFGVYPSAVKTITSPQAYNDGTWHQAVATLSSAGMVLYIDGTKVAADTSTTTAEGGNGWWRVGYDNLSGWTSVPTTNYWTGSLAWAAVYSGTALTAAQVAQFDAPGT